MLKEKIVDCGRDLMHWGRNLVTDFRGLIAANRTRIKVLKSRRDLDGLKEFRKACANYAKTLNTQEIYWQQQAKQYWFEDGDSNTKFFHAYASKRRQNNKIRKLKGPDGDWHYTDGDSGDFMKKYFDDLFTSSQRETTSVTGWVHLKVTLEQKIELMSPLNAFEIKNALF